MSPVALPGSVGGDRFHLIAVAVDFVSGRRIRTVVDQRDRPGRARRDLVGPHSPVGGLAQPPVRVLLRNWRGQVTGVVSWRDVLGVLVHAMDPAVWVLMQQTLSVTTKIGPKLNVDLSPGAT